MRKSIVILFALLSFSVLSIPAAWAAPGVPLNITYTADNFVTDLLLVGSGGGSLGSKYTDWGTSASTTTAYLTPGQTYSLVWKVGNSGMPDVDNPTAFLGQVKIGSSTFLTGSSTGWSIVGQTPVYFGASGSAFNDNLADPNYMVWQVSPGAGIYGIDTTARWMGIAVGGQGKTDAYDVVFRFTATPDGAVAVTPIPGALWLLGGGVAGLAALRRRFGARQV